MSRWIDREMNPATPPWFTVRFWFALAGLAVSVTVLVMLAVGL